ncbi:MAG: ATPase, partial [Merismopedia sp. SIO2A8]|nr:ATPase [Merismopedia sp. SIO2A8]
MHLPRKGRSPLTAVSTVIGLLCWLWWTVFAGMPPVMAQELPPRTVSVHLFEWKWPDIAQECEQFLGPTGFAAVQVSPPNEHAIIDGFPWYERYQPVSYKLESRSGTRTEFVDMVNRCKAVGVDIYVDAIINHMSAVGTGIGIAQSPFKPYDYPGLYGFDDFHHCGRHGDNDIEDYRDRQEVQTCELVGLADLDTHSPQVQHKIVAYLNDLIDQGVAGFRLDASKHISAEDIHEIVQQLNGHSYIYQEVIDQGGEPIQASEYFQNGDVTEFKYSVKLSETFFQGKLASLKTFGEAWDLMPSDSAIVFVDNHDNQRGHGGGGHILTHKDGILYDLANVFMLAWPYV